MMTTVRPRAMRCRCPPDKVGAAFADDRVVAFGQFEDEVVRAGEVGGGDDALDWHAGIGERNVVAHSEIEQHVLLQHGADLPAQLGRVDHRQIDAVDQHPPGLGHKQALGQLGQRALARA